MFDPTESYGENEICLNITGEFQGYGIKAYASPDASGKTYVADGIEIGEGVDETFGSPFPVDIVMTPPIPQEDEMKSIRDELGSAFSAQFDDRIDSVYEMVSESDDPLQSILDADTDDLIVEPDE